MSSAAATPAATLLTIEQAASKAGCASAYLAECIVFGQLEQSAAHLVDEQSLITWAQQSLRPQQLALRSIVDAIDVMEKRSMKPAIEGEADEAVVPTAELRTADPQPG
ncbi:MAG: hypothetical protein JWQ11_1802 [Rhizobacter sp.]|nr:hypothetical protein [Rhizobacter sp.]